MNNIKSGEDAKSFIASAEKEIESLKERLFELYLLYTLSKNLNMSVQADDFFEKTINLLKDSLKIEKFCFMLIDEGCNELKVWKTNSTTYETTKNITFKIGEGIPGVVAQSGESILIQDVSKDSRFLHHKGKIPDISSFLSIPLKLTDNRIMGVLNLYKKEANAFRESDKILFEAVAHNIAQTIERARLYEKAQKEAMFDDMTTLYTRRYFLESCNREYSKAKRYGDVFSVIMADIDYFKYFNDTYGHILGDEILKKLASILKSNVRQADIVSRYGGEEFAILLPGTDTDGATLTAEKLRSVIEKELTMEIGGGKIEKITITAGISTYPHDGKTIEEILAISDKFLYAGKESGRNMIVNMALYEKSMKINEKRLTSRYKTTIKVARGINRIQSIEIKTKDDGWKICTIKDISKNGFKGVLEHKTEVDNTYKCKAVGDSEVCNPDTFSIRIAHAEKIHHNRYQIGVEITEANDTWKKIYTLLTH